MSQFKCFLIKCFLKKNHLEQDDSLGDFARDAYLDLYLPDTDDTEQIVDYVSRVPHACPEAIEAARTVCAEFDQWREEGGWIDEEEFLKPSGGDLTRELHKHRHSGDTRTLDRLLRRHGAVCTASPTLQDKHLLPFILNNEWEFRSIAEAEDARGVSFWNTGLMNFLDHSIYALDERGCGIVLSAPYWPKDSTACDEIKDRFELLRTTYPFLSIEFEEPWYGVAPYGDLGYGLPTLVIAVKPELSRAEATSMLHESPAVQEDPHMAHQR